MALHVNQIKDIVRILTNSGETNKEQQSCLLGYIVGLEAPISLNQNNQDDQMEWNSFFNDLPGEINEHFLLNLALAQDVANLTLQYRQSVYNADKDIEMLAKKFMTLTGAAFGMLGKEGLVNQIRKVISGVVEELRSGIRERQEERERVATQTEEENTER